MSNLKDIKNIILVASGKGGVGKTTVAVNLAVALARDGLKTGLMDADLFGPSVPICLGLEGERLETHTENGKECWYPMEKFGVKIMSLGFFMHPNDPVIWRGPMATKAITQLTEDTRWGELDFLVIDMPPGTGDICLTIAQKLPQSQALVVITPQKLAVADGLKAVHMFSTAGIDIPVLGIVENMSWFTPEKYPDEKYLLFGEGGGKQLADDAGAPLLAQIPLVKDVCDAGDRGNTVFAAPNKTIVEIYETLANEITRRTHAVAGI
jgi:ATP-binding protein involved in chromosome partitioning